MSPRINIDAMSMLDWFNLLSSIEADELTTKKLSKLATDYQALAHGHCVYDEMGLPVSLADAKFRLEEFVKRMELAGGYAAIFDI